MELFKSIRMHNKDIRVITINSIFCFLFRFVYYYCQCSLRRNKNFYHWYFYKNPKKMFIVMLIYHFINKILPMEKTSIEFETRKNHSIDECIKCSDVDYLTILIPGGIKIVRYCEENKCRNDGYCSFIKVLNKNDDFLFGIPNIIIADDWNSIKTYRKRPFFISVQFRFPELNNNQYILNPENINSIDMMFFNRKWTRFNFNEKTIVFRRYYEDYNNEGILSLYNDCCNGISMISTIYDIHPDNEEWEFVKKNDRVTDYIKENINPSLDKNGNIVNDDDKTLLRMKF